MSSQGFARQLPSVIVDPNVATVVPFVRPVARSASIPADPAHTLLGVMPRSIVTKAIIEAEADGGNRQQVTAPALSDDAATTVFSKQVVSGAIGLNPAPSLISTRISKLVVSVYKLVGFAVLTLIVVVLVGYIATTLFYYVNHSWIVPTVVSASDDKVVALKTQLASQQNQRDRIAGDLADAQRAIAAEQEFQLAFVKSIQSDLEGRQAALDRVRKLASAAASTRAHIRNANESYAASSADHMNKQFNAGLIDRHAMLAGNYQLAQISTSSLSIAEREAQLATEAHDLATAAKSLDAILANHGGTALSYDVLKIKHDYDASKLALARATETRDLLRASVARQDEIIAGIKHSAYLRALDDHAVVALVPYDNLDGIKPGSTLHACKLGMIICRDVGTVLEVLPGEVAFHHPHRDTQVRGQMVELRLTDEGAGQDDMLFVNGAPLAL